MAGRRRRALYLVSGDQGKAWIRDGKNLPWDISPSSLKLHKMIPYIVCGLKNIYTTGFKNNTYYKLWTSFLIHIPTPCIQDIVPDTDLTRNLLCPALYFLCVCINGYVWEKNSLPFRQLKSGFLKNKLISLRPIQEGWERLWRLLILGDLLKNKKYIQHEETWHSKRMHYV